MILATLAVTAAVYCQQVGDLAATVMGARQRGVTLSAMMQTAEGSPLTTEMVRQSFDEPRYRTEPHKARAVADYREKWEVSCFASK